MATNENILPVSVTVKSHTEKKVKELGPVQKYAANFTLDFTGVSRAALILLAKETLVIRAQAAARSAYHRPYDNETKKGNMGKDKKTPVVPFAKLAPKFLTGTVNVAKLLEAPRRVRGDKVATAAKQAKAMTAEQRKALRAMLAEIDKAEATAAGGK